MRNKKLLLGGLLLLGIGFAAVSTTLYLTGNVTIATNDADFDVKFTKATSEEGATATISPDGKTITFGTSNLTIVGDISKLDFEVTNNSEMYDAVVSVACSATGDKSSYYEITSSGEMEIAGKTKGTGKVEVKLLKASTEDIHEEFTCALTATAKERTTKARVRYVPKYFAFESGRDLNIPTTASTQDYTTLTYLHYGEGQAKMFLGLDADGVQKSLCIIRNGSLECFKNNNVAEEQEHVQEVFSDITCTVNSYGSVHCDASDFDCFVYSGGGVYCLDHVVGKLSCDLSSDGSVRCSD